MNADKLKKILTDHQLWVASDKQNGKRAHLSNEVLRGADLSGADLRYAILYGADLRGADLRGADLRNANLRGASLSDADLNGADLRNANLVCAVLTGAHFELEIKTVNYFRNAIFSEAAIPWVILHPRWSEFADSVKFV